MSIELTCNLPIAELQTRLESISAILTQEGSEAASAGFTVSGTDNGRAGAEINGLAEGTLSLIHI